MDEQPQPFIVTSLIRNEHHQFLVIRRAKEPFAGSWSFISGIGASKKGYSPDQAANREVLHDIDLSFKGQHILTLNSNNHPEASHHYVYLGSIGGDVRLNPRAATDYAWFSLRELQQHRLAFEDNWIVEHLLRTEND